MKIAIIGAGAMGSVYAAFLAEAGNEVWGIDLWREHVDAINQQGLKISGVSGERTVNGINASTDIADAHSSELVVIATKASQARGRSKQQRSQAHGSGEFSFQIA